MGRLLRIGLYTMTTLCVARRLAARAAPHKPGALVCAAGRANVKKTHIINVLCGMHAWLVTSSGPKRFNKRPL
jgi:GTP-binding protein EngB required for normal cell division